MHIWIAGSGCHNGFNGNGGGSCCTSSNQCEEGEGDCDSDADCKGDLRCGQGSGNDDNCDTSLGFPGHYDCCYNAGMTQSQNWLEENKIPFLK